MCYTLFMTDIACKIAKILNVSPKEIGDVEALKKGMTNDSYLFSFDGKKYIFRHPGSGTDLLINRSQEISVYNAISGLGLCNEPLYIDKAGNKITPFIENARVCNPNNPMQVKACISLLKRVHYLKLKVNHSFDIFANIDKYENLRGDTPSFYSDYDETKKRILSLKNYISLSQKDFVLSHIDPVPDNFLISPNGQIQLIDWEYAGMQDPHVDIAMFAIYSFYDKAQIDSLIDIYFDYACPEITRKKVYCYIAICGLLWSNWCEYKHILGYNFGEYAIRQYNYAKNYYEIAAKEVITNA